MFCIINLIWYKNKSCHNASIFYIYKKTEAVIISSFCKGRQRYGKQVIATSQNTGGKILKISVRGFLFNIPGDKYHLTIDVFD